MSWSSSVVKEQRSLPVIIVRLQNIPRAVVCTNVPHVDRFLSWTSYNTCLHHRQSFRYSQLMSQGKREAKARCCEAEAERKLWSWGRDQILWGRVINILYERLHSNIKFINRLLTSPPIAKSESKSKSTAFKSKSKSESKPKPNEHLVNANPPG